MIKSEYTGELGIQPKERRKKVYTVPPDASKGKEHKSIAGWLLDFNTSGILYSFVHLCHVYKSEVFLLRSCGNWRTIGG